MDECHPDESHWYLPMIGVEPSAQGEGLGAALLRHALARCDAAVEGRFFVEAMHAQQ